MIGRAAYDTPFIMSEVDKFFEGGEINNIPRREVIEGFIGYVENLDNNTKTHNVLKHTWAFFME